MEDNNDKKLSIFQFEGAWYKTQLTEGFVNRKKWVPDNPYIVSAVIPGTVLKLVVKEGQKVNKGRNLYILEAMKMKNRILANISGVVKKIHVEEGQKVSKNELIMELYNPVEKKVSKSFQKSKRSK